jgi:pectinesterase
MKKIYLLFLSFLLSFQVLHAYNVVVAKDGTGDVKTVQAAFDKVPTNNSSTFTIYVKKGTYYEKLDLTATKTNVSLIGEDKNTVILTYDDYGSKSGVGGTDNSYSTLIEADNFYAENITFQNTIDSRLSQYSSGGQAVALMLKGDKTILYNCLIQGFQDTFYTKGLGRTYVKCCQIEGTTDFIFGAGIAVFESCTLLNKKNSYTTAAANLSQNNKYNYVFFNCKLIADAGVTGAFLGRPWKQYAKVVYLRCEEGSHITPAGWADWSSATYASTAYFAEYKCTGPGFSPSTRLSWTHQLSDAEAATYTLANIFAASAASPAYSSSWTPTVSTNSCSTIVLGADETLATNQGTYVSPNPASTYLDIHFGTSLSHPSYLRIYDIKGVVVYEAPLKNETISTRINIEKLSKGLYFYSISGSTRVDQGKFIVSGE